MRGKAILFESGLWARLPADIDEDVALAVLDVAGAPAQVRRLCSTGQTVVIIGADGKSGLLSCAQAKARVGTQGRVIGRRPRRLDAFGASCCAASGSSTISSSPTHATRSTFANALRPVAPELADLVVNCVNVPGTELASILCARDGGTVYFFSMSTSFTAAALGAEGVGRDVTMIDRQRLRQRTRRDRAADAARSPRTPRLFQRDLRNAQPEREGYRDHGYEHHDGNPPQAAGSARAVRI